MEHELYHHGILGMKWGVRRFQNKDGSLTPAGKRRRQEKTYSDDEKKLQEILKKSPEQMSNQELRLVNERLNLMMNYKKLTNRKLAAIGIVSGAATAVASIYAKKYMIKGVEYVIDLLKNFNYLREIYS